MHVDRAQLAFGGVPEDQADVGPPFQRRLRGADGGHDRSDAVVTTVQRVVAHHDAAVPAAPQLAAVSFAATIGVAVVGPGAHLQLAAVAQAVPVGVAAAVPLVARVQPVRALPGVGQPVAVTVRGRVDDEARLGLTPHLPADSGRFDQIRADHGRLLAVDDVPGVRDQLG